MDGKEQKKSGNFFANLFSSLFGGQDAEAEKKRQLHAIAKRFAKTKFSKFYKYQGNEALPLFPKTIYEIYKVIYPVKTMFQNIQNPNILKHLSIDFYTPPQIRQIEESLTEENLNALSKKMPSDNLRQQALAKLDEYSDFFTLEKINDIDTLYNQLAAFKEFCSFDFYFLLKKFNKTLRESDFSTTPQFDKISAEYIIDDLKDFVSVAWSLPLDCDYTNMVKLLRMYKGVEPITIQNLKRVISRIANIKSSLSIEMMIKLISENPQAKVEISQQTQNIFEAYIDKFKQETEANLNKIVEKERDTKSQDISSQLFSDVEIMPLKNFTEELNPTFTRKGLRNFVNTKALSYVKTFLIEIFKKDIHEYYDLVLVRGQWESHAVSAPFSEAYNNLIAITDSIIKFDDSLAEDAPTGMKIKTLLPKTERDNSSKNIVNRLISDANEVAYNSITSCITNLITIGKIVKSLVEDIDKKKSILITNWKELDHYSDIPMKDFSVKVYKKIYLLTTLMKTSLVQPED